MRLQGHVVATGGQDMGRTRSRHGGPRLQERSTASRLRQQTFRKFSLKSQERVFPDVVKVPIRTPRGGASDRSSCTQERNSRG